MWTSAGLAAEFGVQLGQPFRRADVGPPARVARARTALRAMAWRSRGPSGPPCLGPGPRTSQDGRRRCRRRSNAGRRHHGPVRPVPARNRRRVVLGLFTSSSQALSGFRSAARGVGGVRLPVAPDVAVDHQEGRVAQQRQRLDDAAGGFQRRLFGRIADAHAMVDPSPRACSISWPSQAWLMTMSRMPAAARRRRCQTIRGWPPPAAGLGQPVGQRAHALAAAAARIMARIRTCTRLWFRGRPASPAGAAE